jgi:hypothetical protein
MKTAVLMFVLAIASANAFGFCTNSVAWDQQDIDVRQYVCESSSFSSYTSAWDKFSDKLNFTLQDDLVKLYWFMRNQSQAAGFADVNGTLVNGGFVFTSEYKDTHDSHIDTYQRAPETSSSIRLSLSLRPYTPTS